MASASISDALSEAFATRSLGIYYFYTDDESVARAEHTYPTPNSVTIAMRENQLPCDECISLLFEVLNSEGEPRFQQLGELAKTGKISKLDYATEIINQEFIGTKKICVLISKFQLTQKEISESYFYNKFIQCPTNFNDFLPYVQKVSPNRGDPLKSYEQYYESIAKKYNTTTGSQTPKL